MADTEEEGRIRKMILDGQYKCFEKMNRDPAYNQTGTGRRRWVTLTGRVEVDEVARTELGTGRPRWSIVPAKPAIPVTAAEVA